MPNTSGLQQRRNDSVWQRFSQRLDTLPPREAEDSLLLRLLVQILVTIGIIATDIAAKDVIADWPITSYWAIPLSFVGAGWSWHRRRQRNIPTQFCIAIGMLVVLGAFFVRLFGELNDTRLALAQLLIHLQVLHSFDLPRRKDLGYSIIIGLILLGVAGTLSQTLAFGPFLLVFVAIALPVLVLDYRSRLGLVFRGFRFQGADLAPKRLSLFLVTIVSLGLIVFAFLPRLPGYQLRTFPVSPTVEFQGQFDTSRIINPGYARGGRGTDDQEGSGEGGFSAQQRNQSRGPGKVDGTYYYGFDTQINQNLRGQMKPQVVMRVRSQAEGFWRVLAFDRYTGQGWEISRNDQAETVNRYRWSYQFYLPRPVFLGKRREVVQTYTVVAEELPNVIPAMAWAKELYFPTRQVAVDPENSLRSPLALVEGFTYTVVSEVPYRNRTILRQAATSYPDSIRKYYLQLPPEIAGRVRQRSEEILATSSKPLTAPYEKALYLAQYLKQHYTIQPDMAFLGDDEDLVEAFLFKFEGGYPDHFSTVLTVMLRSLGIPSRLATGFAPGEFNPFTGLYVVRNTDAYALTEVYFPKYGWFAFDPIPGHELIPPSIEENQTFSVLRQFWQWVAGWLPSPVSGALGRVFEAIAQFLARTLGWLLSLFSRGWVGLFIGLILSISLAFLGWLSWQGWRAWRYRRWLAKLAPMESLYQQMLVWLAEQGFRKRPWQTPLEYARQWHEQGAVDSRQTVDDISRAYVDWRYGGQAPNVQQLQQRFQVLKKQRSRQAWRWRPQQLMRLRAR
jgi:protein-glutamine gamma-glutamyltransferase